MQLADRNPGNSANRLIADLDSRSDGVPGSDTVVSGYPSVDRLLGGGFRRQDLIVLGGDIGAGKSALALSIALRAARSVRVAYLSGEMHRDRVTERALALESKVTVDGIREGRLTDQQRSALGAAALKISDLDFTVHHMTGGDLHEVIGQALLNEPRLLVVDYLQLLPAGEKRVSRDEDAANAVRLLKSIAIEHDVACLLVTQLDEFDKDRADPRPRLDDYGALGAVKQHADIVLGLYREEMYRPDSGVAGAAELIVSKNRNGPTGFVDLYFHSHFMRFEDMLDPE